jgi:hypothetical protein
MITIDEIEGWGNKPFGTGVYFNGELIPRQLVEEPIVDKSGNIIVRCLFDSRLKDFERQKEFFNKLPHLKTPEIEKGGKDDLDVITYYLKS